MAHLYLNLNNEGKVVGCQTAPSVDRATGKKKTPMQRDNIILVDEQIYNQYNSKGNFEEMVYDKAQGKFEVLPDPRPEFRVTAPNSSRMGSLIDIDVDADLLDADHVILEYEGPDGRIGLIRANIQQNGKARVNIRPDKSGYYRFGESSSYKLVEEQIIAVYEE